MGHGLKLTEQHRDELDRVRVTTPSADVFRYCLIILTQPSYFGSLNRLGAAGKWVLTPKVCTTNAGRRRCHRFGCGVGKTAVPFRILGGGWDGSIRRNLSRSICCSNSGSV